MKQMQIGDTVTIKATITEISGDDAAWVRVAIVDGGYLVKVPKTDIMHHEPRPLEVGDTVRIPRAPASKVTGIILTIAGDQAWVRWGHLIPGNRDHVCYLSNLERMESK